MLLCKLFFQLLLRIRYTLYCWIFLYPIMLFSGSNALQSMSSSLARDCISRANDAARLFFRARMLEEDVRKRALNFI